MSNLKFSLQRNANPASDAERAEIFANLQFGRIFSDHMTRLQWSQERQWHDARVEPYGPIQLDPAAAVLHYAQEIFEGLKAYRGPDAKIRLFRPIENARRFRASAARLAMPLLDEQVFLDSIDALLTVDGNWIPDQEEASLYLRPYMFASEKFLGVRAAHEYSYLVIASPVGPYFSSGVQPISIWVAQDYHRAGPGGTGAAKCGGNYAASLLPQQEAAQHGYDQVLFVDAATNTRIDELGGMNVFAVYQDGTVRTPRLSGDILPGITRSSIIELLQAEGQRVEEETMLLDELLADIDSGNVTELFACGTAAVINPIGKLGNKDFTSIVGDGGAGELTMQIRQHVTDIQYGRREDTFGWMVTTGEYNFQS